ncbi:MAG TPA: prolyl oligopeptidase family serine peptidase, partial [Nannocystaceae bacterium]|nr:prolyl oligopeptidase family serine peptidase [Nannocystaceae bacterium]
MARRFGILALVVACASPPDDSTRDAPVVPPPVAVAPAAVPAPAPALASTYRLPPADVVALVDARPTPGASVAPDGASVLLMHHPAMPGIVEVARPFARLAGMRVDEGRAARRRVRSLDGLSIVATADGAELWIERQGAGELADASWSPDGTTIAWLRLADDHVELWSSERGRAPVRLVPRVLDVLAPAYRWGGDGKMFVLLPGIDDAPRPAPTRPRAPSGPIVEDARGETAQNRTWQDLLTDPIDEALFEHYATGRVAVVERDGTTRTIGAPGMFASIEPSPDGRFLLVETIERPFSYQVPWERFARAVEIWDRDGTVVATIDRQGPAEAIPIDGVRTGPRDVQWIPSEPATLAWSEALDGGDPKAKAEHRDRVLVQPAPFRAEPVGRWRATHRVVRFDPLEDGARALVTEYDRDRRWSTTWLVGLDEPAAAPTKLFDRSVRDAYADPGRPIHRVQSSGLRAVRVQDGAIWLAGEGATPEGDRPFLDRFELASATKTRLMQSPDDAHVEFLGFVGAPASGTLVVRREAPFEVPNVHVVTGDSWRAITRFVDPQPELRRATKKLLKYRRADGVELSATLYLPPVLPEDRKLPLLLWAYPLEYNDKDTAGQVRAAPNRFVRFSGMSPLPLVTQGWAVLDETAMPVIGHPETMNDTLLQQLEMAAAAAIDAAAAAAPIDRDRVAVGGHSYGAFMTANLLAHTDLFRAGIARSGAYNRTLTPFGFQGEDRTYWQARDLYERMSPFMFADQIKTPILLIHGMADNNTGTYPVQS